MGLFDKSCPRGSGGIRRSIPRSLAGMLMAALTPFRLYECRRCVWRGVRLRTLGR
ncbi:MAG TPA: hypothetical protein VFD58_27540 [Blastocatellia bacterium]|nr:hypothetical protein [Blastocatellia bacterium]